MWWYSVLITYFLWGEIEHSECSPSARKPLSADIHDYEPLNYDRTFLENHHQRAKRSLVHPDNTVHLDLNAQGREFKIRLRRDTSIFPEDFQPEAGSQFDPAKLYHGKLEDEESFVHGFIHEGRFQGKIVTNHETYYIEPAERYLKDPGFHSVVYKSSDAKDLHPHGGHCGMREEVERVMRKTQASAKPLEEEKLTYESAFARYRRSTATSSDKRVCGLLLQADHLFTEHKGGKEQALLSMSSHVQAVNHIYRRTKFLKKDESSNIGFIAQRMFANDSADLNSDNPFSHQFMGVNLFLDTNSEMNHDEYCLAYVFTYRTFDGGVLGLAYVADPEGNSAGGICEKNRLIDRKMKSLNTGIVTLKNAGRPVSSKVSEITFAHELGHNFGAEHDTDGGSCTPGGNDGNYIMYPSATSGTLPNNNQFSPCSIEKMAEVIRNKGISTDGCFRKDGEPICGNRVVETKTEECDCGFKDDCKQDVCCYSADDEDENNRCKRKPGKLCSPSEGLCCKADCTFHSAGTHICRSKSDCKQEATCGGNATCPKSEPKPDKTICKEGTMVCLNGECTGSICLFYNMTGCECTGSDDKCDVCCKDNRTINGPKCISTKLLAKEKDSNNNQKYPGLKPLKLIPGDPCDNFKGYCDVLLKCRKVDTDGPLSRLKDLISDEALQSYLDWIKAKWWIVLLGGVGLIAFMALFIKCCSVHTPSSNPNRKPARALTLRRNQPPRQRQNPRGNRPPHSGNYGHEPPPPYNNRHAFEMSSHK